MTRLLSFGGSTAIHVGLVGGVVLAGWLGYQPPQSTVASHPPVPLSFDVRHDSPAPTTFEAPALPETLPLPEPEMDFQAETALEDLETPVPDLPGERPAPSFHRPLVLSARLPEPAPLVESETAPMEIHNPPPAYPPAARRRSREGHVIVELRILTDGRAAAPMVVECDGSPLFAEAALKAVENWRYQPATLGGIPVERVHRVRFTFKIR